MLKRHIVCFFATPEIFRMAAEILGVFIVSSRLKRSPPPRCPYPMLRRTRHPHRGRNNGVIPMPVDVEPSTRVGWYRRSAWVYTVIAAPPLIPSSFARLKMSVKIFYLFSYHGEKNEKKFFASYDFFCIFASLVKGVSLS